MVSCVLSNMFSILLVDRLMHLFKFQGLSFADYVTDPLFLSVSYLVIQALKLNKDMKMMIRNDD